MLMAAGCGQEYSVQNQVGESVLPVFSEPEPEHQLPPPNPAFASCGNYHTNGYETNDDGQGIKDFAFSHPRLVLLSEPEVSIAPGEPVVLDYQLAEHAADGEWCGPVHVHQFLFLVTDVTDGPQTFTADNIPTYPWLEAVEEQPERSELFRTDEDEVFAGQFPRLAGEQANGQLIYYWADEITPPDTKFVANLAPGTMETRHIEEQGQTLRFVWSGAVSLEPGTLLDIELRRLTWTDLEASEESGVQVTFWDSLPSVWESEPLHVRVAVSE